MDYRNLKFFTILALVLIYLIGFVGADIYNYYYEDSVVPSQRSLNVKDKLLVNYFTGSAT